MAATDTSDTTSATDATHASAALTVVIPTHNERARIGPLLERLFMACERAQIPVDVVVVDDASADGTGEVAEDWASRRPVRVVHRPGKFGLASAVLDGFRLAHADIVGVMDGDLSHPPELLPDLFRLITGSALDVVVASRYVDGGGTRDWPAGRRVLSRVGCFLARPVTPVRDAMSGFFLLRRERLKGFRTSVRGFKIGLELLVRSQPRRLAEMPYVFVERAGGASKMNVREAIALASQLARLYWSVFRGRFRPPTYVTGFSHRDRATMLPECAATSPSAATGRPAA
jgi:dolichol-phosphate mannosyltransferase